jgi:hypothetical protein
MDFGGRFSVIFMRFCGHSTHRHNTESETGEEETSPPAGLAEIPERFEFG